DIIVGEETSLLAQGLYSDNTIKDLSTQVAWRSANPDIVKVDRNGQVTAIAPGETTITATIGRLVASVPTFVGYGATASPTNDGTSPSPARSPVPRPSPGIP
ncbi:TPA: Ig-like domain-containing protein, partial [Shigella flexneri]|nr:Ig-like domain-containing protein [Shigella flexneri]